MKPFDHIRDHLGAGPRASTRAAQRARFLSARSGQQRVRRAVFVLATAVSVGLLVGLWVRAPGLEIRDDEGPVSIGAVITAHRTHELRLSDGSRITLSPGSVGHFDEASRARLDFTLNQGHLEAAVQKHTGRTWRYHAGDWVVRVVGTQLSIDFDALLDEVTVAVTEGVVEVSGPGETVRVSAGERWRSPRHHVEGVVTPEPMAADAGLAVRVAAPLRRGVRSTVPETFTPPAPELTVDAWRTELAAGHGRIALQLVISQDASVVGSLTDAELLALADVARTERELEVARRLLKTVLEHSAVGAPEAAFLLGRVEFEAHAYEAARTYFAQSLQLDSNATFSEQAQGRLIETLMQLEHQEEAERAARAYLERYPAGGWSAFAKHVIEEHEL